MLLNPYRFGVAAADPNWASVFSLVHFNGADGSTAIACQKGVAYVRNGDPVIQSGSALYGAGGGKFFGNTGYNMWKVDGSVSGNFSGTYTMEAMVRFTDATQDWIPFSLDGGSYSIVPYLSGSVIKMQTFGGVITGGTSVLPGQWVHIAVVKNAGTLYLFVKGILQGSLPDSGTMQKSSLTLGGAPNYYSQVRNLKGDMDEFRFTDGTARYTSNFTAPTAAFPDS